MLRLHTERTSRNLTQEQAGKILGVTKASFSNIETGKRLPSLNLALKMQNLFGASIEDLLSEAAQQQTN